MITQRKETTMFKKTLSAFVMTGFCAANLAGGVVILKDASFKADQVDLYVDGSGRRKGCCGVPRRPL